MTAQKAPAGGDAKIEMLGALVADFPVDALPQGVREAAQRQLLDVITTVAASRGHDIGDIPLAVAARFGAGDSPVWFSGTRTSMFGSAFANSQRSVAMDLGSNLYFSQGLPGLIAGPALALAHERNVDGTRLLAAIALGFEAAGRIALSMTPPYRVVDGAIEGYRSPRSRWIAFGAAAAAAKVLDLDAERTAHTLSLAGSMIQIPTGPSLFGDGRVAMSKYGMAGAVAMNTVLAALLAEQGFTGDRDVLEANGAFYAAMDVEQYAPDALTVPLGESWHILASNFKRVPAGTHNQQALHTLASMMAKHELPVSAIREIRVGRAIGVAPVFSNRHPASAVEAQFSLPYAMAMVALDVPVGDWDEHVNDPATRALCELVILESDPDALTEFATASAIAAVRDPWTLRTRVTITTADERLEEWSDYSPVSLDELTVKAAAYLPDADGTGGAAERLKHLILSIDDPGGVERLLEAIA